jgi:hypothetical protein
MVMLLFLGEFSLLIFENHTAVHMYITNNYFKCVACMQETHKVNHTTSHQSTRISKYENIINGINQDNTLCKLMMVCWRRIPHAMT